MFSTNLSIRSSRMGFELLSLPSAILRNSGFNDCDRERVVNGAVENLQMRIGCGTPKTLSAKSGRFHASPESSVHKLFGRPSLQRAPNSCHVGPAFAIKAPQPPV